MGDVDVETVDVSSIHRYRYRYKTVIQYIDNKQTFICQCIHYGYVQ